MTSRQNHVPHFSLVAGLAPPPDNRHSLVTKPHGVELLLEVLSPQLEPVLLKLGTWPVLKR